jgi:hypothetical protein
MADNERFPYFEEIKNSITIFIEEDILNLKDKCNSKEELYLVLTVLFFREISKQFPNILILKACLSYNLIDINKEQIGIHYLQTYLSIIVVNRYEKENLQYYNIVELLLEYGADPNLIYKNNDRNLSSPTTIAILRNHNKVATLLIEYGGIINEDFKNKEDFLKNYSYLEKESQDEILEFVEKCEVVNIKPAKRSS